MRAAVLLAFLLTLVCGGIAASSVAAEQTGPEPSTARVVEAPVLVDAGTLSGASAAQCFGTGPDESNTVFGEFYSCDPTVDSRLAQVNPENSSPPIACDPDRSNGCFWRYADNPSGMLPAWRWRDNVGLYSNMSGLDGIIPTLFSFLASVFFALSQLFWWILLEVCQWVLTDTLVQDAGQAMNRGYTVFTDLINASGILLIAAGLGLFILVRLLLRGRLIKVTGMVLAFIIPLGVMQGLAIRASEGSTNSSASAPEWVDTSLPTGSPAWLAVSGVNLVDGLTSWFTSGFGRLATISGSIQIQQASAVDPSCSSYVAALYDQYYAYSSAPVRNLRDQSRKEYEQRMEEFLSREETIKLRSSDPLMFNYIYGQVSRNLLGEIQRSIQPPDPVNWTGQLAARSSAEKIADARHYKVATVSQLWQRAFLGSWTAAQFGNQVYGAKMYCHLLEWNADIEPDEQMAIADVANRYSYVSGFDGTPVKGAGYEGISLAAFEKGSGKEEMEQHLFAWAACRRAQESDGSFGWKAEPAWAALGNGHAMSDEACKWYFEQNEDTKTQIRNTAANIAEGAFKTATHATAGSCISWSTLIPVYGQAKCAAGLWNSTGGSIPKVGKYVNSNTYTGWVADWIGDTVESDTIDRSGSIKPLNFKDEAAVDRAVEGAAIAALDAQGQANCTANPQECADAAAAGFENAKDAGKMVKAFKGNNPSQRLTLSILALVTSVIYTYALGFLALGSFIAKFGLVLMIILLPATLLALAWPSGGEGTAKTGKKMLRLTGGFVLSHGMLSFVLGLMLSTILLFESFINGDGGSFIHALIPLAALFIVRKVLQMLGLGDLGSIQGALGMPLSASLAAAGKDWQTAGMRKFGSLTGGEKIDPKTGLSRARGLSRLDALAKRTGKGALMFAPNRAAAVGKWTGRKLSDRYALPERKAQLLGVRDADGNLVEAGLAQRMKNFAGLMSLAGKIPGIGHAGRAIGRTDAAKDFSSFVKGKSSWVRTQIAQDAKAKEDMRRRREHILSISGKNMKNRHEARVSYMLDSAEARRAQEIALKDADGNIIRDASGRPVYGYEYAEALRTRLGSPMLDAHGREVYALQDIETGKRLDPAALDRLPNLEQQRNAAGNLITGAGGRAIYGWSYDDGTGTRVLNFDEYQALTPTQKRATTQVYDADGMHAGVRYVHDSAEGARYIDAKQLAALSPAEQARAVAVTDPRRGFLTDGELIAVSREYAERFQLRPGQAVMSVLGEPIVQPVMGDADGNNRVVITKNAESSKDLAAHYRIQYLPNAEKARPKGFTDDQYAVYLKLLNEYHNGYNSDGSLTDVVYELTGFTWDSAMGQRELNLLLEGKECALKDYRPETPPDILASIQSAASQYSPRTEQRQIFADIATERYETLSAAQLELGSQQEVISNGTVQLEAYRTEMRGATPKLKAVRTNIETLQRNRAEAVDIEVEVGTLETDIRDLEATITRLSASSAPSARAALSVKVAELANLRSVHDERRKALDDLEDAIAKAAASEAEWVDEERKISEAVRKIADDIATVSRTVFDASKRSEELGKQMEFAFKAMRRDKGKEDWSKIDDLIDDWIKGHNNKWAADGRDLRALEQAFEAAVAAGEEVHMRKAYDELAEVLNRLGRTASRTSATGSAYHGYIINDLAKLEGSMRHVVETNPEVIPWTGVNYMDR